MDHQFDLTLGTPRELNHALHHYNGSGESVAWQVVNASGLHNLAVGMDAPLTVNIEGHVGYYCAGMNKHARITVHGNAGTVVADVALDIHRQRCIHTDR